MAKRLVLDLDGIIDDSSRYTALMEKLERSRLLSNEFLYRGTDTLEIDWLKGKTKRPINFGIGGPEFSDIYNEDGDKNENSIDCYTFEEMKQFLNGEKSKTPMWYAIKENIHPIIAVYKTNHMEKPEVSHSDHQYTFKDPDKRLEALAAFVELRNYD